MTQLTEQDVADMRHALGRDIEGEPAVTRNCFMTRDPARVARWDEFCGLGFARLLGRPAPGFEDSAYALTPDGVAALNEVRQT